MKKAHISPVPPHTLYHYFNFYHMSLINNGIFLYTKGIYCDWRI